MNFAEKKQPILLNSVIVANREQISTNLGDEVVILHLDAGSYYSLDQVGVFVWNLIQEPRKVSDIRDAIFEEYEVDLEECERDLLALLEELAANKLLDVIKDMDT
jgi:Coenzyme PQQ synthesis protein D (PqqD)